MRLTSLALAAIALFPRDHVMVVANVQQHVAAFPEVTLFPEAHYKMEVDSSEMNAIDSKQQLYDIKQHYGGNSYFGSAFLGPSFLHRMRSRSPLPYVPDVKDLTPTRVQTKLLTESSPLHVDTLPSTMKRVDNQRDGPVGFFVQKTNGDAYFDTLDGNFCIPMVEGSFVSFDGSKPHRTVINLGEVHLLGPILLSSTDEDVNVGYGYSTVTGTIDSIDSVDRSGENPQGPDGSFYAGAKLSESGGIAENYYYIKFNVTGLPPNCNACQWSLADASQCTLEAHSNSSHLDDPTNPIPNPFPIDFTTDADGSSGGLQKFVVQHDIDVNAYIGNTLFLHDGDDPLACAVIKPLDPEIAEDLLDEWMEAMEGDNISSSADEAIPPNAGFDPSPEEETPAPTSPSACSFFTQASSSLLIISMVSAALF